MQCYRYASSKITSIKAISLNLFVFFCFVFLFQNKTVVDWSDLAENRMYPVPARQTRDVGRNIAALIDYLVVDEHVAAISQFHLIGISLGAHVAGFAGQYVKCGRIPRITGLDPARPAFEPRTDKSGHLDSSDAEFVDIIHTCGGTFGMISACGHV